MDIFCVFFLRKTSRLSQQTRCFPKYENRDDSFLIKVYIVIGPNGLLTYIKKLDFRESDVSPGQTEVKKANLSNLYPG